MFSATIDRTLWLTQTILIFFFKLLYYFGKKCWRRL